MKNRVVYIIVQPSDEYSYWVEQTLSGILHETTRKAIDAHFLTISNSSNETIIAPHKNYPILIVGYSSAWLLEVIKSCNTNHWNPTVVNAQPPEKVCSVSAVCFDFEKSIYDLLHNIASSGRRRIALVGCNPDSPADNIKQSIFNKLTRSYDFRNGLNNIFDCEGDIEACFTKLFVHLNEYDSVICANDTIAILLVKKLVEKGYSIPDDLFVSGMGNSNIGKKIIPAITTIDFDYYELGRQSISLYLYLLDNTKASYIKVALPCNLLIRESTTICKKKTELLSVLLHDIGCNATTNKYYENPEIKKIIRIESVLQKCDFADNEILSLLMGGKTYEEISDKIDLSIGAIKYRIKKMMHNADLMDRCEMISLLKDVIINFDKGNEQCEK